MIWFENPWTGLYMIGASVMKELSESTTLQYSATVKERLQVAANNALKYAEINFHCHCFKHLETNTLLLQLLILKYTFLECIVS